MNYHIITQDKFFHSYIEDFYRLGEEKNNKIWIRGDQGDGGNQFQTDREVEYLGKNWQKVLPQKLTLLKKGDKLFVSWYDLEIGKIICAANIPCPLYVCLMGGEFYAEPVDYHAHWLYDPMTRKKIYEYLWPKHKPWRWYRYYYDWKRIRACRAQVMKEYEEKNRTTSRIDYIVLTEHSGPEVEFVKKLYPLCKAKHLPGVYDQNFELAEKEDVKPLPLENERIRILFGHSCDPTGNQIDGLHYISKKIHVPYEVWTFLSYGDEEGRKWTMEYGKRVLGDKFHPIVNFMTRPEFVKYLNTMDVLMMYHNRQQAEGNIMTALVLGKPVFMKPENPQYGMLKRMGVKSVYDVHQMHKVDLREAICHAQENREDTIRRISAEYSLETRLKYWRNLLAM